MHQSLASVQDQRWGHIVVEPDDTPLPRAGLSPAFVQATSVVRHVWHPPAVLAPQLPPRFALALHCVRFPDGQRRWYPVGGWNNFIVTAFAGGLAILDHIYSLSPGQRSSYRLMFLLWGWLRHRRERLGNDLHCGQSLRVARTARDVARETSILPEDLGLTAAGKGEPWTLPQLAVAGRRLAEDAGRGRLEQRDLIHFGLVAAARRHPLYLPVEQVAPLVRMALYDPCHLDQRITATVRQHVEQRLVAALHQHLEEPADAFDSWFSGVRSSLVHQLAKRKRLPGGALGHDVVRRVLVDLGWEAYAYVAGCLHAQMRLIGRLLPEPLNDPERTVYEQLYVRQPPWGGLPFVLLVDRFGLLRSVLEEIGERPGDPEPVAVAHRLLHYYQVMATNRRAADVRIKRRRSADGVCRCPITTSLQIDPGTPAEADHGDTVRKKSGRRAAAPAMPAPEPEAAHPELARLARQVRHRRGISCSCGATAEWTVTVVAQSEENVTLRHECLHCQASRETELTLAELRALASVTEESGSDGADAAERPAERCVSE